MTDHVARILNVTKVYQKNKAAPPVHALGGVDLDIPRGQYLSIMGPSGSGKSTLMNIVGCLDKPTAGQYLLDGDDVAQMDDQQLSKVRGKRLGFVFQAFNLIPQLTVLDNVVVPLFYQGIPATERRERAEAVLEKVELADRITHRPNQLSGGQMQRVAIARALVNEPSILLADEPTGNLDTKTGNAILALFDELHEGGLTIVMVTHDPEMQHRCERVVKLRDGLINEDIAGGKAKVSSV
ncbi:MAG: ABC transporter ATP-binding protein [Phycisphaeraceae bacterium]